MVTTKAALATQENPAISVNVRVVNVLASVRDKKGAIVTNLEQDDFKLEEDGHPQAITYFASQTDLPLTVGLLVDTSFSQRRVLTEERDASQSFLDNMLREGQDQAFLIHFDRYVELLQDLTSSHQKLEAALKLLAIAQHPADDSGLGGEPTTDPGRARGGTALYDTIFLASDEVIKKQRGRKALIVLSDGVDRGSNTTLEHAIETAQRVDTIVYSILFADEEAYSVEGFRRLGASYGRGAWRELSDGPYPQQFPEERPSGKKILAQMSRETGGWFFEVSKKQPVEQIYRQIEEDLRSQYSLGYTPDPNAGAGYHKLRLTTNHKDYVVQAREGYYSDR
jgi:VWFA-related protein